MSAGIIHRIAKEPVPPPREDKLFGFSVVQQDVFDRVTQGRHMTSGTMHRDKEQCSHTNPRVVRNNVEFTIMPVEFLNAVLECQSCIDCKMRTGTCNIVV